MLHSRLVYSVPKLTFQQSSLGRTEKGSFLSLGLTIVCRKLKVWLSQRSTNELSHSPFAAGLSFAKTRRASSSLGSSGSSRLESRQLVGNTWYGFGLGAGVGGEAGAEGRRGLPIAWGIDEALGVRGGLGNCRDSRPREERGPTETGTANLPCAVASLLPVKDDMVGELVSMSPSMAHPY